MGAHCLGFVMSLAFFVKSYTRVKLKKFCTGSPRRVLSINTDTFYGLFSVRIINGV